MDISWEDARIFLAVAETGSFSAAARRLKLGQPTISRRIADFEFRLGQVLFHRGRRGAELTPDGARLLPAAQQMARWAVEMERAASQRGQQPQGKVRLTAPPGVAHDFLVPFCVRFQRRNPRIKLELLSSIEYLDLNRGEADLAIRQRPPSQRGLMLLRSLTTPVAAYAAPDYVQSLPHGYGLADVDWIGWAAPYDHLPPGPQLAALIPDFEFAFTTDSHLLQQRACALGQGAMFMAQLERPWLPTAALTRLELPELPPLSNTVHLVCPSNARYIPRVRVVIDGLMALYDDVEQG